MTLDEKIALVHGHFPRAMKQVPTGVARSAGYIQGIPRLGIPALRETDASLGVAVAGPEDNNASALPSGLALASTWDVSILNAAGSMIGKEAVQKGYNVLLAGGVNLVRDPFNGRNFEYLGEDPLLAGRLVGASISGIQSNPIIATAKHYLLNSQETGRHVVDARIDDAGLRESDLLAFELAIESGRPGAVMCSYNKINGVHACENPSTLAILRNDWNWSGWVMSDWGAVHSVGAANSGLDQESGQEMDRAVYFDAPLKEAVLAGTVPLAHLDEMVHRIVRTMLAAGLMDLPSQLGRLNVEADNEVALRCAEAGIVVLRNQHEILPLSAKTGIIAVIGGHADIGVLSGGGSAQVLPDGSVHLEPPDDVPQGIKGPYYHPSSPVEAIRRRAQGSVRFLSGDSVKEAVEVARKADIAIVFAEQWTLEGQDANIRLSDHQEALITAVATANPKTIVVLETGGAVLLPWRERVPGLVEAWYSGGAGGEAIAEILFGEINPSGRLPVSFAASPEQLPRATPPGLGVNPPDPKRKPWEETPFSVNYGEGSSVGYRWFSAKGYKPAYPFGFGLSYSHFRLDQLSIAKTSPLTVKLSVRNIGNRDGLETAQLYLEASPRRRQERLLGWAKVHLEASERKLVKIVVDPRLLANWDIRAGKWRIDKGKYRLFAGPDSATPALKRTVALNSTVLKP